MTEKLWSECSPEEKAEVSKLEKQKKKLMKYIGLGYLSKEGEKYFKKELDKLIRRTERKYREQDKRDPDEV